jgi:hypothetical protein
MSVLDQYQELNSTGITGGGSGDQTPPEEEFFHSIYISGQNRQHQDGTMEEIGKLQIRGHSANHQDVYMIITHIKDVLNNESRENGRTNLKCFSFKESSQPPWYGSNSMPDGSPRVCPVTSKDRQATEFCQNCKAQIIVAGILCQPTGTPILDEEKKPVFVFIRGKGIKYGNVSDYLSELYQLDLDPVFNEEGDAIREFEKRVVNHKRFVTKISQATANSNYGVKMVFAFERLSEINKEFALELLDLAKNTMDKFREKFDWSKKKKNTATQKAAQDAGVVPMENTNAPANTPAPDQTLMQQPPTETKAEEKPEADSGTFSFKDIKF